MESIIEIVVSNGIFACLFVWLLFYQLKDSSNREKRYIDIISELSVQLEAIEDVKEDVKEIKTTLLNKKVKIRKVEQKVELKTES